MITAAITMAMARLPFFSSSHSSTGVSHVKTNSKIQRDRTIVIIPTTPHPINFRYSTKISMLKSPLNSTPQHQRTWVLLYFEYLKTFTFTFDPILVLLHLFFFVSIALSALVTVDSADK